MDLSQISDHDLQEEIEKREKIRKEKQDIENQKRTNLISEHLDAFISLSRHTKTNCCDTDPRNYWRNECPRCSLLFAKSNKYVDFDIEISVKNLPD